MLAVDFTKENIDLLKVYQLLGKLKPQEFCYIKLKSVDLIPGEELKLIQFAVKMSKRVSISVPHEEVKDRNVSYIFADLDVQSLCIRVKTNPEKFGSTYNYGTNNSGDRDLYFNIKVKVEECPPGKEIALEFENEKDFRMVGSTLALLHETGVNWAILNPGEVIDDYSLKKYRDLFEFLRMRRSYKLNVYFNFLSLLRDSWQLQTMNTFSGLREVHIDISNKCTHSCAFCGLYSPQAQKNISDSNDPAIMKEIKDYMRLEIDGDKALDIIKSLPFDVQRLQMGGVGDPLMHARAIEFIVAARERGFILEVLSNMEYLNPEKIELISKLGATGPEGINFIVNISGGSVETYIKTRPKQTEKSFNKVTENLKYFSKLKKENHNIGAWLTLMCVVTKDNVDKLSEIATYAKAVGANGIWFKPMELHAEYMKEYLPTDNDLPVLKQQLKESLDFLDNNKIHVLMRDYCEQIIRQ